MLSDVCYTSMHTHFLELSNYVSRVNILSTSEMPLSSLALSGCHLFSITLRTLFVICHTAHLKIDFVQVLSTWEETTCMNAVSTPIDALYGQKGLPWAENRHFGLHDRRDLQFYNIFNTQSHACRIVRQPHHLAPNL